MFWRKLLMKNKDKINYIVEWMQKYTQNADNKIQALVVGVSGGIDSALTSTLCALTNIRTIVLCMPIKSNINKLGSEHCKWLVSNFSNVESTYVDLTKTFAAFESECLKNNVSSELGFANSKARLRMTLLYQVASSNYGLVVGTGNKVEDFGIGFYTKYGDGGVDISPIADLNKTTVRELSKELKISQKIIDAPPTDGLWDDGRTDEDQIGLTYEELENAMIDENSINRDKYIQIRRQNLHKMNPIPICKFDDD